MKRVLYFAYGSNMFTERMLHRVPSARVVSVARLDYHCLTFHKKGVDYTGKCSIEESPGNAVWGVLYTIAKAERHKLDTAEGQGYDRVEVHVLTPKGRKRVFTYKAKEQALLEALPAEWYRDIVLAGAKEHGLPIEYVEQIALIEAEPDQ